MALMNVSFLNIKKIRFHFLWNLVFCFLLIGCTERNFDKARITVQWNGEKAEAVLVPMTLLPGGVRDSIAGNLQVRLVNNAVPVIHDELKVSNDSVIFKPLIAFTPGLKYEVLFSNKIIGQFEIPPTSPTNLTEILSVYPTADTLPENALKLYITFSKPMQEGQALHNIAVIKNDNDTMVSTFLDLSQELWNRERTILTLWFDPGRIKRDLQPNKSMGAPLQKDNRYKLIIDKEWRDERGLSLKSSYQKNFVVAKRDNISPNPDTWVIHQVKASTKKTLTIDLQEPLDYLLLKNTIRIMDANDKIFAGSFEPGAKETVLSFTPHETWKTGDYLINIESRLEDLAGNNLNRLFDNDLARKDKKEERAIFTRKFSVN